MNCLIYVRVSTDKQADKELSIPAQLSATRQCAQQRNWRVLEEFVESGASAKTADRPELKRLLARCRSGSGRVNVVLVHKIDRLARNVADHAAIRAVLQQQKIRLVSVSENLEDSISGQLVENIMAALAEFYSNNLADEVRKGMRQKVLQGGWPHKPPRGYRLVSNSKPPAVGIQIDPTTSPLVAKAFELFATGWYSIKSVAERLAKGGLLSSTGKPLAHSYLRELLSNPFYVGRLRWKDLEVPGTHGALVSPFLFARVQEQLAKRRTPGPLARVQGFPLRGLAVCSACRGRLTAERHDRWNYYRCSRRAYQKGTCQSRFCNADRVHRDLECICGNLQISESTAKSIEDAVKRTLERRLATRGQTSAQVQVQQNELLSTEMRLTEAFVAGDLSPEIYRLKTADLRKKRAVLDLLSSKADANSEEVLAKARNMLKIATSIWTIYEPLDDLGRAQLLRSLFASVVLSPEGIVGFALKPPFDLLATAGHLSDEASDTLAESLLDAA